MQLDSRAAPLLDEYRRVVRALLPRLDRPEVVGSVRITPSLAEAGRATIAPATFAIATSCVALFGLRNTQYAAMLVGAGWLLQLAVVAFGAKRGR